MHHVTSSITRLAALLFCVVACACVACADEPSLAEFRESIREINAGHAAALVSGKCSGRLVQAYKDFRSDKAETLVDCDFEVVFDGDRIRLERNYRENNLTAEHQRGIWDTSQFVRQVFIYRGDENYWARFDAQGNVSCRVLNRQWAQTVMQYLDWPWQHPVRLWEPPSHMLHSNDDLSFETVPLQNSGIIARGSDGNYFVTAYLLPPKPLRLSRLTLQLRGAIVKEYNLTWAELNGAHYVQRYVGSMVDRQGNKRQTASRVIEMDMQEANTAISPAEFELSALGVAAGTEFRANAPIPTRYVFDGERLVRETQ